MKHQTSLNHSWLPIAIVVSLFMIAMGLLTSLHHHMNVLLSVIPGLSLLTIVSIYWLFDIILAKRTPKSRKNFYMGLSMTLFSLFILWFAYLQVPLFHFVCHHFGIDGNIHNHAMGHEQTTINYDQPVKLQFTTTSMRDFPVKVKVDHMKQTWYPGGQYSVVVSFVNEGNKTVDVHPILSATPERSTLSMQFMDHLPDTVSIKPGMHYQKSIQIRVNPDFPKDIHAVAMLFHSSDHSVTDKPGQQTHWHELRSRYHHKRI